MERYFIAISLPDDIGKIIMDAQKELLRGHLVMAAFSAAYHARAAKCSGQDSAGFYNVAN